MEKILVMDYPDYFQKQNVHNVKVKGLCHILEFSIKKVVDIVFRCIIIVKSFLISNVYYTLFINVIGKY